MNKSQHEDKSSLCFFAEALAWCCCCHALLHLQLAFLIVSQQMSSTTRGRGRKNMSAITTFSSNSYILARWQGLKDLLKGLKDLLGVHQGDLQQKTEKHEYEGHLNLGLGLGITCTESEGGARDGTGRWEGIFAVPLLWSLPRRHACNRRATAGSEEGRVGASGGAGEGWSEPPLLAAGGGRAVAGAGDL
ncbi:unnamed protein product [Urochloa humidicola]